MSVRTEINTTIPEEGTIGFTCAFTDEAGTSTVPDSITWTLTDDSGNVINSRSGVSKTPGASVDIVLSGDDLAIGSNGSRRRLLIEWAYTSDLGTSLPDKHEVTFKITDFLAVS